VTRQNPVDLIRGGKLPEKDFPVCVDPDLVSEHDELVKLRDAAAKAGTTAQAGATTADLDERVAGVLKQMEAATVTLRLRALNRRAWKALKDEHPPRRNTEGTVIPEDLFVNVHRDEFFDALVRKSIVDPELDDETMTVLIEDKLTDGQWEDLTTTCWNLNETSISVPFSSAASTNRRTTSRK
jgi:hypothetical protein